MQEDEGPTKTLAELAARVAEEAARPQGKALEAAEQGRVICLADTTPRLWLVIGEEADYIVIPRMYCSCPHFIIRVLGEGEARPCYHLVAVEAVRRGRAGRLLCIEASVEELTDIIVEVLAAGRSKTLRRILYSGDADPRRF